MYIYTIESAIKLGPACAISLCLIHFCDGLKMSIEGVEHFQDKSDFSDTVYNIRHELSTFIDNTHISDIHFNSNISVTIELHDYDLGADVHFCVQRGTKTVIELYFNIRADSVDVATDIHMTKLGIASLITSVRIANA